MKNDPKYLHELLNIACGLIDELESLHTIIDERGYQKSELCADVQAFFNDVKALDEDDDKYRSMSADEEAQDYNTFSTNKI